MNRQGDLLADEGMERAQAAADVEWLKAAKQAVWDLIRLGEPFTTDAVWLRLSALGVSTDEGRALGSVIRAAARAGLMTAGVYVKSERPECHSRPVCLWLPTLAAA